MKIDGILNGNARLLVVAVCVVIILLPFGYSLVSAFSQDPPSLPEDPDGESCIHGVSREYMRYHHMDILKEVRDEIVRKGSGKVEIDRVRRPVELDDCKSCHPSREEFCNRCHDPVNLYPDCFRCHEYPD